LFQIIRKHFFFFLSILTEDVGLGRRGLWKLQLTS